MPRGLHPDVAVIVAIHARLARDAYTTDPQPIVDAVLELAGDRTDLLAVACGEWVGSHENIDECMSLAQAIRPFASADAAARARDARRNPHSAP